jgi:hypothetical protein
VGAIEIDRCVMPRTFLCETPAIEGPGKAPDLGGSLPEPVHSGAPAHYSRRMLKRTLATLSLALAALSAHAVVVSQDYATAGDGLLTYDSATGLQWLDWSVTAGLSAGQVLAGAGGWIQDFRFASADEVRTLFADAGLGDQPFYVAGAQDAAASFTALVNTGGTNYCESWRACGIVLMSTADPSSRIGVVSVILGGDQAYSYVLPDAASRGWVMSGYGSVLVRNVTAPIPEPSTLGLSAIGLAALAVIRRRSGRQAER